MSVHDKDFYNSASAAKLGWDPTWFCAEGFDDTLVENVKDFQRKYGLDVDGLVGPATYRRATTWRESLEEDSHSVQHDEYSENIICDGEEVSIDWPKVITMGEPGALVLPEDCYRESPPGREPKLIVTHWDAALSAKSCHRILSRRNISSHFVIDNDGTIYQMMDTNHVAWHAGKVNKFSIGIDFSNAFYTKYQSWYTKNNFGLRPVLTDSKVHGRKVEKHLGYYKVQIEAYKALIESLCRHYDIPLECPMDGDEYMTSYHKNSYTGKFSGVVCHFNISKKKIDCAGLELDSILEEIRNSSD
tara:strand:+ start:235 stop:1140 length:906 start_codon:yes stop_codon:yes gene_type:complete